MVTLILVKIIKEREMNEDFVTVQDQLNGKMVQVIQASGLKVFVMVMAFTQPNQEKNIVVNGKMMYVMAKVSGLNQMDQ